MSPTPRFEPDAIVRQRWFRSKSRAIGGVCLADWLPLGSHGLALVEVSFREGEPETYLLVLRGGSAPESLEDCLGAPGAARALFDAVVSRRSLAGREGGAVGELIGAGPPSLPVDAGVHPIGGDQSNSTLAIGPDVVLKLYRKIEPGLNPEVEIGRFLSSRTSFRKAPAVLGALTYRTGNRSADLLILQERVSSDSNGWVDACASVRAVLNGSRAEIAGYAERARELGRATGEMHVALASDRADPTFCAEPCEPADLERWTTGLRSRLASVARRVEGISAVPVDLVRRIEEHLSGVSLCGSGLGVKTRHHGDYHLGQVLLGPRGWSILDFEGEPARSLEERRRKHTALKDVAGMLRSFNYAAEASLFDRGQPGAPEWKVHEPRAEEWEASARKAFLDGYRAAVCPAGLWPTAAGELLGLLEIDKAVYELDYELGARPDWVRIPVRGIERILDA